MFPWGKNMLVSQISPHPCGIACWTQPRIHMMRSGSPLLPTTCVSKRSDRNVMRNAASAKAGTSNHAGGSGSAATVRGGAGSTGARVSVTAR